MKLVWVLLFISVIIYKSEAKSVSKDFIEIDGTKTLNPSSHTITRRRSDLFPNMPKKFVINLNPMIKSDRSKPEKYRKRLMKKLPIKYVNYEGTSKIPVEVTTRRTLMQKRRFTVKPHDVYAESIRETYNWNGYRKINNNNLKKSKSEKKIAKTSNEEDSAEERFINYKNIDNESDEFGTQENINYLAAGSQKSKIILRFPKRNNGNTEHIHKQRDENKVSDIKTNSNVENNQNTDDNMKKLNPIKSDSKDVFSEVVKPKDNLSDPEEKDQEEFIFINGGTKTEMTTTPTVVNDDEISTDSNFDVFV